MGGLLDKTHYVRCETSNRGQYKNQKTQKDIIALMESKGFIYLEEKRIGADIFFVNPNFK